MVKRIESIVLFFGKAGPKEVYDAPKFTYWSLGYALRVDEDNCNLKGGLQNG
jgi:hypothetical protein